MLKDDRIEIGDHIDIYDKQNDYEYSSTFEVQEKDGEDGFHVYCLNGSWYGVYDPDMKMLFINYTKVTIICTHKISKKYYEIQKELNKEFKDDISI